MPTIEVDPSQITRIEVDPSEISELSAPPTGKRTLLDETSEFAKGFNGQVWDNLNPKSLAKTAYNSLAHPIDTYLSDNQQRTPLYEQAKQDIKKGNYADATFHGVTSMLPFVGAPLSRFYDSLGGDVKESGKAAGTLVSLKAAPEVTKAYLKAPGAIYSGAAKLGEKALDAASPATHDEAARMVVQSLRGSAPNGRMLFEPNLKRSMPLVKEVAGDKPIEGVDHLIGEDGKAGLIKKAKDVNRQQYNELLNQQGEMGRVVDGTPIAEAMEKSISKKMKVEGDPRAAKIQETADAYRKGFTVEELDDLLQDHNNELDSYYAKNPSAKRAAQANPDIASTVAQADATRNLLYKALDGEGEGAAARELQKNYGALSELQEALQKRKNVAARQAPNSLNEQITTGRAIYHGIKGTGKAVSGNPEGLLDIAGALGETKGARLLKDWQSTDGMLKRAFRNYDTKPTPIEMPEPFKPAGLLEPGPIRMGGVPDPSGPMPNAPEPQRNPGYWSDTLGRVNPGTGEVGAPMNRRITSGNPKPVLEEKLGSSHGDSDPEELIPVVHPHTGEIIYAPRSIVQGKAAQQGPSQGPQGQPGPSGPPAPHRPTSTSGYTRPADGVHIFSVEHAPGEHITVAAHPEYKDGAPGPFISSRIKDELRARGLTDTNVIGAGDFNVDNDGRLYPQQTHVEEPFQRRGIASDMYNHLEETTGRKVKPSSVQSDEGAALSKNRKPGYSSKGIAKAEPESKGIAQPAEEPLLAVQMTNKGWGVFEVSSGKLGRKLVETATQKEAQAFRMRIAKARKPTNPESTPSKPSSEGIAQKGNMASMEKKNPAETKRYGPDNLTIEEAVDHARGNEMESNKHLLRRENGIDAQADAATKGLVNSRDVYADMFGIPYDEFSAELRRRGYLEDAPSKPASKGIAQKGAGKVGKKERQRQQAEKLRHVEAVGKFQDLLHEHSKATTEEARDAIFKKLDGMVGNDITYDTALELGWDN